MKSLKEIGRKAEKGDYTTVARIVGKSSSLVHMVVSEQRKDNYNIQRVFSDVLETRERLMLREQKRRERQAA